MQPEASWLLRVIFASAGLAATSGAQPTSIRIPNSSWRHELHQSCEPHPSWLFARANDESSSGSAVTSQCASVLGGFDDATGHHRWTAEPVRLRAARQREPPETHLGRSLHNRPQRFRVAASARPYARRSQNMRSNWSRARRGAPGRDAPSQPHPYPSRLAGSLTGLRAGAKVLPLTGRAGRGGGELHCVVVVATAAGAAAKKVARAESRLNSARLLRRA